MQKATEIKSFTCICCPLGCNLEVSFPEGKELEVEGYHCARGAAYAKEEATNPKRMVTALVQVKGCLEPLSVKSASSIAKKDMPQVIEHLRGVCVEGPVHAGHVVIDNIAGTNIAIIATKSIP